MVEFEGYGVEGAAESEGTETDFGVAEVVFPFYGREVVELFLNCGM